MLAGKRCKVHKTHERLYERGESELEYAYTAEIASEIFVLDGIAKLVVLKDNGKLKEIALSRIIILED